MQSKELISPGNRITTQYDASSNVVSVTPESVFSKLDRLLVPVSTTGKLPKPLVPHAFHYTKHLVTKGYGDIFFASRVSYINSFRIAGQEANLDTFVSNNNLPSNANVANKALDKLNQKVRTDLDLSVSAFEWKQTARMVSQLNPRGLANMERELFRKLSLRKDWRHITKIPADLWLQYQYGFRPLMSDIWSSADEAIRVARNGLQSFEASSSLPLDGLQLSLGTNGYGSLALENLTGKQVVKYGIRFDAGITDENRAQHFTSLNPVSIAWELIPYSFVVDWFVDIGTTLRSFETSLINNVAFQDGYKTELTYFDADLVKRYPDRDPDNLFLIYPQVVRNGSYHYSDMNRTLLSTYPMPSIPRFKSNLGSAQLLSAAALLAQFLHDPLESKSYKKLLALSNPEKLRPGGRKRNAQSRALRNN